MTQLMQSAGFSGAVSTLTIAQLRIENSQHYKNRFDYVNATRFCINQRRPSRSGRQ